MPAGGLAPTAHLHDLLTDVLLENLRGPARLGIFGLLIAADVLPHQSVLVALQDQLRADLATAIGAAETVHGLHGR